MPNRKERRATAIKGDTYYGELTHKVVLADLVMYTNKELPDGVMIVSQKDADRIQALVDEAVVQKAEDDLVLVRMSDCYEQMFKIEEAGVVVTPEEYVFMVSDKAKLEVRADAYPLEVIVTSDLPADTLSMVVKKEGK
jgi:hypothetical protein